MQKIHVHNDFDVHLNFDNIKTDYVSRVEFWTRRDDIYCCCKCDGSLKVEDDSNIVCYLNDHNLGTGKLNYNVIFQIPDPNYADGYKKVCQHYVSDIFLTSDNGDTTVAIVKVLGDEKVTDLINRLSEFEKVFDKKQDKLKFDDTPTSGSKNVVYSDGIYNAIKNNKPDLSDYAKKSDLEGLASEQWVDDKGYLTEHQSLEGYVTESELNGKGYLTEHQSLTDYAKKSDIPSIEGLATEQWVNDKGYITSIPSNYITESELDNKGYLTEHQSLDDYAKKTDVPNTHINTVKAYEDTKFLLISNQYLKIIPLKDAVKLTFNRLDNTDIMREYHIVIDCTKAVPVTRFIGVLWEVDNEPVFEKGGLCDIVIRYDGDNFYGSWKAYKLMPITILITTSGDGADDITINGTTYKLAAGDNSLTNIGFNTITDIGGFYKNNKITSIDFDGATIKKERIDSVFSGISRLTKISNLTIKGAESFAYTFMDDSSLKEIDTSDWNTSSANNFSSMFRGCSSLISLDVSGWNTSNVEDFSYMFRGCSGLKPLDVSKWNTSKAAFFSYMFYDCSSLTSIDVSHFDTSKAGFFSSMFYGCSLLKTLDVSKWNTSSAKDFSYMFYGCTNLKTLDVSKWNTSEVTNFSNMFYDCSSLTSIDVSHFDTSKAAYLSSMFAGCSLLKTLDVSKWNTSKVIDFYNMFRGCSGLATLDLSNWNVSKATSFSHMFYDCTNLATLDLSGWNTSSATSFSYMFLGCSSLTSLDLSNWNVSKATDFEYMFYGCTNLATLDLSNWNASKATDFNFMFSDCSSLTSLDLSGWNTSSATSFSFMFRGCSSLTSLDLSGWNTSKAIYLGGMFYGCTNLAELDISGWNISEIDPNMFTTCNALTTIKMKGCSQETIDTITSIKPASATIITE